MRHKINFLGIAILAVSLAFTACDGSDSSGEGGDADVIFQSVVQTGGTSGTVESTSLELTFDVDPTTALTADNITVTGATKGALTGEGTTRTLAISDITVTNGAEVSVKITNPESYSITGSLQTAVVYRKLIIGMSYDGGKLAYILQDTDPGYEDNVAHGLIAASSDQNEGTGIIWAVEAFQSESVPDGTGTAIGTGFSNTDKIIAQNGAGITYAAGLARACEDGGYTDWFLPSRDELNKLYDNRETIGGFSEDFNDNSYWSSSEYESNSGTACFRSFVYGNQGNTNKNDATKLVRAVRNF